MIIKWEKNSRVNRLVAEGKIRDEDVISRTQTDNFPAEAATVRLAKVRDKNTKELAQLIGNNIGKYILSKLNDKKD